MGNFPTLFIWTIILGSAISEPSVDYEDDVEIEDILELVEEEPEEDSKKAFDPDPKKLDPNFKPSEDDPRNIIFNNYEDWTIQANLERLVNKTFTLHLIELKDFTNHVTLRKVFILLADQISVRASHFLKSTFQTFDSFQHSARLRAEKSQKFEKLKKMLRLSKALSRSHFENHLKSKVTNTRDVEFISKSQKRNWNRSLDWS